MVLSRLRNLLGHEQSQVTAETIRWAYRLILGREPSPVEVLAHLDHRYPDLQTLRRVFFNSKEFQLRERSLCSTSLSGFEPALEIQEEVNDASLEKLLMHIQQSWQELGQQEPHWSVLTTEEYKQANLAQNRAQFYASGQRDAACFLNLLRRNHCFPDGLADKTILEYGCGVGRITHALASHFKYVYAYDVSAPHLALAREFTNEQKLNNIEFKQILSPKDITNLPRVDAVFTLIVLQHNPPPVISLILRNLLYALNQNGVAYFQLLTYQEGYSFDINHYLNSAKSRTDQIEMHVLPQNRVFEIINQANCQTLEVLEDAWAGYHCGQLSNTFLVRKIC